MSNSALDGPGNLDRFGNQLGRTMRYSFGVSRGNMKKGFVDEIFKHAKDAPSPSPNCYTLQPGFGVASRSGNRYTMRQKIDMFAVHLEKQKKLPGPGCYSGSMDLTGKA